MSIVGQILVDEKSDLWTRENYSLGAALTDAEIMSGDTQSNEPALLRHAELFGIDCIPWKDASPAFKTSLRDIALAHKKAYGYHRVTWWEGMPPEQGDPIKEQVLALSETMTPAQVASEIGRSKSYVYRVLKDAKNSLEAVEDLVNG